MWLSMYLLRKISKRQMVSVKIISKQMKSRNHYHRFQWYCTDGRSPGWKILCEGSKTAHGYVLDKEPRYVDLSYRDQDTPVITYDEKWQNARQKVKVTVLKKEKDTERVLAGGVFGLYTSEDIKMQRARYSLRKTV